MKEKNHKMLCLCVILAVMTILPPRASSQSFHETGTIQISTNPVKLIMGLVNFEFEYFISPAFSIQISSEYLVSDYAIKREKHPDFLVRIGPRFHFFYEKEFNVQHDLYSGIYAGYIWSKSNLRQKSIFLGADIGYKYMVHHPIFINPKFLLSYPLKSPKFLPGFECLLGSVL